MANEISQLNTIRLRERRSVPWLANAIGIERSTLQRILKTPGRQPRDTTLFVIQQWLKRRKATARRRARALRATA